jgi:hypothetical protein
MEPHEKRLWPLDFVAEVANVPVIVQVWRAQAWFQLGLSEFKRV